MHSDKPQFRECSFERSAIDEKKRTVQIAWGTELPVDRGGYMEVLDMASADLSRLNSGAAPLLVGHDTADQVGVIEKAWIGADKVGRAICRFSKSQRAEEVFQDVVTGIRKSLSCGYRIIDQIGKETREGVECFRFSFMPYEASFCSVPADPGCVVGRSADYKPQLQIMQTSNSNDQRIADIRIIAKNISTRIPDGEALADEAILRNWSVDDFQKACLDRLPQARPIERSTPVEFNVRDAKRYSIGKAIAEFADTGRLSGFEAEVQQEYTRSSEIKPRGFWAPMQFLGRSLVAGTATLGGNLVAAEHMGDRFIEALRSRSVVMRAGAQFLTGLQGNIEVPKQTGTSTASWKTEIEAATQSNLGLGKITLTPHAVTGFVVASRQLAIQGIPQIDDLIKKDLTAQLSLALDSAVLRGIGGSEPTGIIQVAVAGSAATLSAGVNLITIAANGGVITYSHLCDLEAAISSDNADTGSMTFLVTPGTRSALRKSTENTVTGQAVWQNLVGDPFDGRVLGRPALVSTLVPSNITKGTTTASCSVVYLGDFSNAMVGSWGPGLDILTDVYTNASTRQIRIFGTLYTDAAIRAGEAFGVIADCVT